MADNISITTGTGTTIATDQVGTAHYQKVKIAIGSDDVAAPLVFGQTSMTASLPVTLASDQSTVPVSVVSFTPSGTQNVLVVNTPTVSISGTPTVTAAQGGVWNVSTVSTVLGTIAVTGTVTGNPSGTQNVLLVNTPVVTASQGGSWNIATVSTLLGTMTVSITNTPITTATISNTKIAVVSTAHSSVFNGFAVSTTSGSSVILKTSGSHTLYITDLMFSVDVPMSIDIKSDDTVKATVYLATKGGFVFPTTTPFICNSAQSLKFQQSASGSCAGYCAGYTVT